MAILSNVNIDGVEATYFKIRDISINNEKHLISFTVYGYASIEARKNKENAIYAKSYEVSYEDVEYTTKEDIFAILWEHVRGFEMFKGYIDLKNEEQV